MPSWLPTRSSSARVSKPRRLNSALRATGCRVPAPELHSSAWRNDQELADRVRALLAREPVVEKPMFGGLAFLVGGHMGVCVSGQGGLMVRVDPAATEALLAEPGAQALEMGRRGPLKGWLRVDP